MTINKQEQFKKYFSKNYIKKLISFLKQYFSMNYTDIFLYKNAIK